MDEPESDPKPEPKAEHDPMIGGRIGPVRIEKRIAGSDDSVTYVGEHHMTNQEVIIKALTVEASNNRARADRFLRESDLARSIENPGIVKVTETGTHEDRFWMICESVRGMRLDDLLQRDGRLSFDKATRLVRDIAQALEALHEKGIVHRDVRFENILLDMRDKPKICDLSRAAPMAGPQDPFPGTPGYAAPEQAQGHPIDARADIFSLGVIYYRLLSGKLPYSMGETATGAPRPIEQAYPSVDKRAVFIMRRLISAKPADRYASAKQVSEELDAVMRGPKPIGDTRVKSDAEARRNWLGMVVLLLAGGVVVALSRPEVALQQLKAAPVAAGHLFAAAIVLATIGRLLCSRLYEDSRRPVPQVLVLLASAVLCYLASTGGSPASPFSNFGKALVASFPLAAGAAVALGLAIAMITGRRVQKATRHFGTALFVLAVGLVVLFGVIGSAGVFHQPRVWVDVFVLFVKTLPSSGAALVTSVALFAAGILCVRQNSEV